jgi:N-acetylmuramic acid 6-phosphate etherase
MTSSTEDINPFSVNIHEWDEETISSFIHLSDIAAYEAVGKAMDEISKACRMILESLEKGGRVIYLGAGTSGRVAAQDVVELLPTYDLGTDYFDFILAGGVGSLVKSVEGAEDDRNGSVEELKQRRLNSKDTVVGISASGTTPFVLGGMEYARTLGCRTIGITNNHGKKIEKSSDLCIELLTGPEVIQGSTRMKAGTAQKMALNIISTTVAVRLGRSYRNTMSHMGSWYNEKLKKRSINILVTQFSMTESDAVKMLTENNYNINRCIEILKYSR